MECVAAYLLCIENNLTPTKETLTKIISSVDPEFSTESLELFLNKISGKTHQEIIEAGISKMACQPAAMGSASSAANNNAPVAEAPAPEAEESSEEIDLDF